MWNRRVLPIACAHDTVAEQCRQHTRPHLHYDRPHCKPRLHHELEFECQHQRDLGDRYRVSLEEPRYPTLHTEIITGSLLSRMSSLEVP
jgi:hypothetical protein